MPLGSLLANPIALAAVTVIAIGVITYQIISQKQKRKYNTNGRRPPGDSGDGPGMPDMPDDDPRGPRKPNDGPRRPSKPDNSSSDPRKPDNCPIRRRKPDNNPRAREHENPENKNCSGSSSGSFNGNRMLSDNVGEYVQNTDGENGKILNSIGSITQNDLRKPDFVKNIDDEDSHSFHSDTTLNSIETNVTRSNAEDAQYLDENSSPMKDKNSSNTPCLDSAEEIYKRKVCDYLKTDFESMNFSSDKKKDLKNDDDNSEFSRYDVSVSSNDASSSTAIDKKKDLKNYNVDNSDFSGYDVSASSNNGSTSGAISKKRSICKGCEEELANAVAYPCKHCYLCFDCAIKIHRIFKKCTVCNTDIETYETLEI